MRDRLVLLLRAIISLALVLFVFSRVNLNEVASAIASANYIYLLLALALYLVAICCGTVKWQVLLRVQRLNVPFVDLLSYTLVGLFFGNFLPTNVGGDIVRGYGLARHTEMAAEAAISVLVDRLVGLIAFMSMAGAMAILAAHLTGLAAIRSLTVVAAVALMALLAGFAVLLSRRTRALLERLFNWRVLLPLAPLYGRLSQALTYYRRGLGAMAQAFSISLLVLIITNFVNYLIALSLGGGIDLLYIFLFNPLIAFVLLVPISIGGIGLNQSAYVFFFNLVGVMEVKSLSLSLIMQVIIILSSLPGGFLWWRRKREAPISPSKSAG